MPRASYTQSDFTGGEWSPEVQGRAEVNAYKTGLNKCLNYYPLVQGALTRRQGFQRLGYTRSGPARIESFDVSGNQVVLEFSNDGATPGPDVGHIRFWQGIRPLANGTAQIVSISTDNPAVVTTTSVSWATGDNVFFSFDYATAGDPAPQINGLGGVFTITVLSATTFSIAVDGSTLGWLAPASGTSAHYIVTRIAELVSPYITSVSSAFQGTNGEWEFCSFCQDESQLVISHPRFAPRTLQVTPGTGFGFTLNTLSLLDGPYLDINTTTTTLTPSGTTGSITVTASSVTGINNGSGFVSTDVGRHIRVQTLPAAWDPTSNSYKVGDLVTYTDGLVYSAIKNDNGPAANNGTAAVPTNIDHWSLVGLVDGWGWLKITAVGSTTSVTATVQTSTTSAKNYLFKAEATVTWQLGLYSDTTGWPTTATFHENRLWFAGVTPNRADGSMVGLYGTFSPSDDGGTVGDANAIASIAKANQNNKILWLSSDDQGLLFGSVSNEGKLKASSLDDPLTPASEQVRRITSFGSAPGWPDPSPLPVSTAYGTWPSPNATTVTGQSALSPAGYGIPPILAGRMHLFIQRMQRKVIELGHPTESGSFYTPNTATDLTDTGQHLTVTGVQELAYLQTPIPMLWARRRDGQLIGCSYRREGEQKIAGWHPHVLGRDPNQNHDRLVRSICSAPALDQSAEYLYAIIRDGFGT